MQNPFLRSASPKFASRSEVLGLARKTAQQMAANHPEVSRVILFGSLAREDFGVRSDMDLLILLKSSHLPIRERIREFLKDCSEYPTDVFPLTEGELESRLKRSDPFWMQAVREGIECYRR
jgi:predicted nucleotidyltransferase